MENLSFNMFDAIVIGLIILLSIKGLLSGFTKELFNAIGLIGGLFVASYYKKDLAQYAHSNFLDSLSMPLLELLSLLIIFIAVFIIAKVIYKIIESLSNKEYISGASRLGGMLIKMLTLFFVFSLIIFGLSSKPQVVGKFKDTLQKSKLYSLLRDSGSAILNAPNSINRDNTTPKTKESNSTKSEIISDINSSNKEEKSLSSDTNSSIKIEDTNSTEDNSSKTLDKQKEESNNSAEISVDNNNSEHNSTN